MHAGMKPCIFWRVARMRTKKAQDALPDQSQKTSKNTPSKPCDGSLCALKPKP
jgi:hypothetical protein